ncbi:MAG: IS200/IS605 family element transposase accessory protein TnpB [Planctomycetes bacterium]|nr:IS200/IS605 family element transposase accessory protein TnpB [Planctomycetota bacterium]
MSTKAFTARLIVESPEARDALWRTHRLYNECLRFVLRHMHKMKRGEADPRYGEIFGAIRNSQHATAVMEAVTDLRWKPKKDPKPWHTPAAALIAEGKLLFDRWKELPGLPGRFHRKLWEGAYQAMDSHKELMALWVSAHQEWQKARAEWEAENPEYMKVRPALEAFEREHGQAAKRRQRWHKWLAFMRADPRLAAWRGGKALANPISDQGQQRLRRARRNKRNKVESEEFFNANPELKELDKLHGYYQREYVRPWAKKRNPDGFRHRPTFTEPSPEKHPFWYQFKKGETYKALDLQAGTISLQLLAPEGAKRAALWTTFAFRPDPRLRLIQKANPPLKEKFTYAFADPAFPGQPARPAEIRGAKLIFRRAQPDGAIYLSFTCDVPDLDSRLSILQKSCDKYGAKWACKKAMSDLGGQQPVTCAVDLGLRHLGAATVRRDGKIVRARLLREEDQPGKGPALPAIAGHKRALAKGRRKRGKPIAGEESFIELQRHTDKMGEDRFKKGARRIVAFARENGADLIILEKLGGDRRGALIPDAERERGINRALVLWNRGNLAKWVKQLAADAGMRVVEVHPYMTSQLCSRCGAMGARFSAKEGLPAFEPVGKLFACPDCGYLANADHNASVNLHKRFFGELPEVQRPNRDKRVFRVTPDDQPTVEVDMADVEKRILARGRADDLCRGKRTPF